MKVWGGQEARWPLLAAALPKGEPPVKEGRGLKSNHERQAPGELESPTSVATVVPSRYRLKAAAEPRLVPRKGGHEELQSDKPR